MCIDNDNLMQGTWKSQIRTKFKNMRRGEFTRDKDGECSTSSECAGGSNEGPLPKRPKMNDSGGVASEVDEDYEHNKYLIDCEWSKPKAENVSIKGSDGCNVSA